MTTPRAWQLPEQHLMPDAVVAFVDGELTPTARDRAAAHLAGCPSCAAEAAAQRQARAAISEAVMPRMSSSFLESLRSIPQSTAVETGMADVAVGADGELYLAQRPDRTRFGAAGSRFGSGPTLGDGTPIGGRGPRVWHAGVVVGGLMLGALALVLPGEFRTDHQPPPTPGNGPLGAIDRGAVNAGFGVGPATPQVPPVVPTPAAGAPTPAVPTTAGPTVTTTPVTTAAGVSSGR